MTQIDGLRLTAAHERRGGTTQCVPNRDRENRASSAGTGSGDFRHETAAAFGTSPIGRYRIPSREIEYMHHALGLAHMVWEQTSGRIADEDLIASIGIGIG